jgi:molecular chaperone DnaK
MAKDNVELGNFGLVGIPPAQRGIPQIEVTFDIDANGILHVSAKDMGTGKEQKITITAPHKLNKDEVERMMKEAEKFADEDKKRKESIDLVNEADALVYTSEKAMEELKDKTSDSQKEIARKAIGELKEAIAKKDEAKLKEGTEKLKSVVSEIGASFYQKGDSASNQGTGEGPESQNKGQDGAGYQGFDNKEDVQDGDFSEVK